MLAHLLIFHGRRVCDAKKPRCGECTLADVCPSRVSRKPELYRCGPDPRIRFDFPPSRLPGSRDRSR